jgi:hypothetical protein
LLWHHNITDLDPQVDTLVNYLVDSLQSYETDYSDALCPMQTEADKSFMGDHLLVQPVTTNKFRMFSTTILSMLQTATLFSHPGMVTPPINSFSAPGMSVQTATMINDPWLHIPKSQRAAPTNPILNADPVNSADLTHLTPNMDSTFSDFR